MTQIGPVRPHFKAYVGPDVMCQLHIQWLRLRLAFVHMLLASAQEALYIFVRGSRSTRQLHLSNFAAGRPPTSAPTRRY